MKNALVQPEAFQLVLQKETKARTLVVEDPDCLALVIDEGADVH
jgi:hypothetical protein